MTKLITKRNWSSWLLLGVFVCLAPTRVEARKLQTDIEPGMEWLDTMGETINAHGGCVLFHQGIYYWYGELKVPGLSEAEHADGGVRCYASTDLINWRDMGMMLSLTKDDPLSDLAFDCNQDRPKVVYNSTTRKFVLFFKLYLRERGTEVAFVGVATSDSPTGPFNYRHKFVGGNSPNGTGDFAMFQDDDGVLYHFAVRKPDKDFVVGKMRDDYLLPEGEYKVCQGVLEKTEAPAVFKLDGNYHMLSSGSSGWDPNAARHYTTKSLDGEWKYLGNPCRGENPHNGLGPEKTFGGQASFVLTLTGRKNSFIAMFDINKPESPSESLYIWLPITFEKGRPIIAWKDRWNLSAFESR